MEITGKGPDICIEAYTNNVKDKGTVAASEPAAPVVQTDKVELSPQAREIQEAKRLLAETPDIRTDKIEALQQSLKNGTYEVKGEQVAVKMIGQSLLIDEFL